MINSSPERGSIVAQTKWKRIKKKVRLWHHYYFDGFVFIHINKTGGTSIERALDIPSRHKTVLELMELLGPSLWAKKYSFTIVRNPWDKVVSQYHYRVQTNQIGGTGDVDFRTWVRSTYGMSDPRYCNKPRMFMPQCDWLRDTDGNLAIHTIMRFESLAQDFESVCRDLNLTASLPHVRASRRGPYRDYYDPETRQIVETWFRDDVEAFDYKF